MFDLIQPNLTEKNNAYMQSAEWKKLLENAETAVNSSYTIIFREKNGELAEAWHFMTESEIPYIKTKYSAKGLDIIEIRPKEKGFGERLKSIRGRRED